MIFAPSISDRLATLSPACVIDPICVASHAAGSAAQAATGSVFDVFATWLSGGSSWLVQQVFAVVVGSDAPGTRDPVSVVLTSSWFVRKFDLMLTVMAVVLSPLLLAATIAAIIRQDLGRLLRTWAVALPVAVVCAVVGVELTEIGLSVCDDLCRMILDQTGDDAATLFVRVAVASPGGVPSVITCLVSVLVLIGSVFLWLEMLMRATAIYLAAFFLPLVLAGMVWPATSRMTKRLVEVLVALVFSKFVVVAAISLGVGAVSQGGGAATLLTGAAMLLLASFAPFALLKLIPIVEVAAIGHLEGLGRRSAQSGWRAANNALSVAASPLGSLIQGRFRSPDGAGRGSPSTSTIPERAADYVAGAARSAGGGSHEGAVGLGGSGRAAGRAGAPGAVTGGASAVTGGVAAGAAGAARVVAGAASSAERLSDAVASCVGGDGEDRVDD